MGTYSVKSDFPETKSLNLYLLVPLLPPCLEQTMPNSPACRAGKDPPSPFFSPGLYRWIARSNKNQVVSCTPPSTLAFMNSVLPLADMWDISQPVRRVMHQITVQNSRGTHPSRTAPVVVMSNETSNHNAAPSQFDEQPLFHTSVHHHLKPRSIASASIGTHASPW